MNARRVARTALVLGTFFVGGCQTIAPEMITQLEAKVAAQADQISVQQSQIEALAAELTLLDEQAKNLHTKIEVTNASRKPKPVISQKAVQQAKQVSTRVETPLQDARQASEALDSSENKPKRVTVGRVEKVSLPDLELTLDAGMDTGINSSSISAINLQSFERDGKEWVRFKVEGFNKNYELPVSKYVKVKQAGIKKDARRPVVQLRVKIGGIEESTNFTLVNRSNLQFAAVIGRAFLQDYALVDVSKTYLQSSQEP